MIRHALLAGVLTGCMMAPAAAEPAALAQVKTMDGKGAGVVALRQTNSGLVWLNISLSNLPPGMVSFHIHETGKCEPDFKAAGGHFNPTGASHGVNTEDGPHAGDFPNILIDKDGTATVDYWSDRISLKDGDKAAIFDADGSAVMVHGGVDDYESQPSGAAGERIACGVIKPTGDVSAASATKK